MLLEDVSQLHRHIDGILANAEVKAIRKQCIELNACHTALCQQSTMSLHMCEESLRSNCHLSIIHCPLRKHHRFATQGTAFRSANIEGIAMMSHPSKVEIASLCHQAISQSCTIDVERHLILSANVIDGFQFYLIIYSTHFRGHSHIHHSRHSHVFPRGVGKESFEIGMQVVGRHSSFVRRQGYDLVSACLHSPRLVNVDVRRLNGNHGLIRPQQSIDDRCISLRSACQEEDVCLWALTRLANLLPCVLTPHIEAIRSTLRLVGFHQMAKHLGVCSIVVITFKRRGYQGCICHNILIFGCKVTNKSRNTND